MLPLANSIRVAIYNSPVNTPLQLSLCPTVQRSSSGRL